VLGRDGVENEVESVCVLAHLIGISRNNDLVCAEAKRVFCFVRRSGKHYGIGAERMSKLYRHMTYPAKTYHTNLLAFGNAQCRMGEYVVIPAQRRGAVPPRFRSEGTRKTKCSLTSILSE
jgi:hypothetical protein